MLKCDQMNSNKKLKVVGFSGSARADSVNRKILALAQTLVVDPDVEFTIFDVHSNPIPMYEFDTETRLGFTGSVLEFRTQVLAADGVVFASPEFNAGYTPLLKSIIDWGSRPDPKAETGNIWAGKLGVLLSASPSPFGGMRSQIALRQTLAHVEMNLISHSVTVPSAYSAFAEDGSLVDEKSNGFLLATMEAFIETLKKLKA